MKDKKWSSARSKVRNFAHESRNYFGGILAFKLGYFQIEDNIIIL